MIDVGRLVELFTLRGNNNTSFYRGNLAWKVTFILMVEIIRRSAYITERATPFLL